MNRRRQHKPASGQDIMEILGPAPDEEIVNSIMRTGADRDEVLEAFEWLDDDDYMGAGLERPMNARSQQVYDIMRRDRERDGRDER